ncbi:predicted protein [Lichtheimia corymbifera JMRC:FSU:9682]|uniref:F-box domain-containing protein n=1 Tax=Lichtheimia corymbifera JMRC:FSU:9682 TaxID=1263082 RepID=A0A068SA92_9FUNG|nr:predicted protein [Lichtheimia corymbifera JMRC:FSU:9682]
MLFPPRQLPFEILAIIADFCDPQQHFEAIYVNRTWNRAFGRLCFRNVTITTRWQARQFFDCLTTSSLHGRPIGQFMKSLRFANDIGIAPRYLGLSACELDMLPRYASNLERLDFKHTAWRRLAVPRSWRLFRKLQKVPETTTWYRTLSLVCTVGHSLRHLKLGDPILQAGEKWMALLAFTPTLDTLELYSVFQPVDDVDDEDDENEPPTTYLTYSQLRSVLGLLPRLRHLELHNLALLMSDQERQLASKHDGPYPRLQQLIVQSQLDTCYWLVYFTTRFPNIDRLHFELTWRETAAVSNASDIDIASAEQSILTFASGRPLQELILIDMTLWCRFPSYRELFDAMRAAESRPRKLSYLRLNLDDDDDITAVDEDYFYAMLRTLHPNTTELQAFAWEGLEDIHRSILIPLRNDFSCLTTLHLKCMGLLNGDCPLDLVLECCPNLKRLTLTNARTTLRCHGNNNNNKRHQFYPLEQLRLCEMGFSTDVMNYVGEHCRGLRELHIQMCNKIYKENEGGRVLIDMPYQTFDKIIIEVLGLDPGWTSPQVHLYPMAFFSLLRLDWNQQWMKRKRIHHEQQQPPVDPMISDLTRWYHLYDIYSTFSVSGIDTRRAQRLSSENGKEIASYSMTQKDWKCIGDHNHVRWVFKKKKNWRRDLYLGYTNIRCRSIKLLHIDGVDIRF